MNDNMYADISLQSNFCWALPSRWRRILQIPRAASCLPDLLSCLQDLLGRTFYSGFTQAAPPQAARVCMTCLPGSKTPVKISSPIFYHCPCKMNKGSPAGPNHLFFFYIVKCQDSNIHVADFVATNVYALFNCSLKKNP